MNIVKIKPADVEKKVCDYMNKVYMTVKRRNPHENEFHQAVKVLCDALVPVFEKNTVYMKHNMLERIVEPERVITFQVPWVDDEGNVHVNRGYRVQFNNAVGPYK